MDDRNRILEVEHLSMHFESKKRGKTSLVKAVDDVSFYVKRGETFGLVGESGCGKTTTGRTIIRLYDPTDGTIRFDGTDISGKIDKKLRKYITDNIAMIFQDPMSSLNPVVRVGEQIAEVIRVHEKCTKKEAEEKAMEMLETVGIPAERAGDFPHQFSGGMKQRVVIAIALACNPKVLIADEPTTALDVTIQAQVLEMMRRLKDKYHTATLLITHDLGVVAQMCEKVAIIYAGEVVESGAVLDIYKHTLHPYTEGLLGAIPQVHLHVHRLSPIDGLMPDPMAQRTGCPFADRCKYAFERCRVEHPRFIDAGNGHRVRCFKVENELRKGAGE